MAPKVHFDLLHTKHDGSRGGELAGSVEMGRQQKADEPLYAEQLATVGLLGAEMDGINGYAPASATDLVTRVVLYAAGK